MGQAQCLFPRSTEVTELRNHSITVEINIMESWESTCINDAWETVCEFPKVFTLCQQRRIESHIEIGYLYPFIRILVDRIHAYWNLPDFYLVGALDKCKIPELVLPDLHAPSESLDTVHEHNHGAVLIDHNLLLELVGHTGLAAI